MQTIEIYTGSEKISIQTEDYNPILLNEQLNNGELNTVLIGDFISARLDVKRVVVPIENVDNASKKAKVLLRNGQSVEIPVDNDFDIKFLNAQLNSSSITTVLIGCNIYQKFEVAQVGLIKEEPTDPVTPPTTEEPPENTEQL
ncbi:hypothetical protein SAMN04487918_1194 [Bacillus sp. bc15]|uniref:hypothetical protein n=1 Tax=Bacillus TaxID=1386 RepID=UPI00091AE42E|nr:MULTISPECIES: hypothetical protein [Bacillus]PFF00482.1 hypothetical protein CN321_01200 [Bacillus thuringiensis]PFW04114.1 hypothetical protein COL22_25725 [Bacillus thuringiensis]SHM83479.1 hypothetical protein SAMN04487918_1194 [Bacillus sp. bc15]